ncbi:ankyrin repeat domain-containing protein [Burkholderia cepacia]|uniref:ankyrin repeat domain-containing protein n=1 Tax=Burkholderia cepacia TaxID=292 RepID=UPI00157B8911|nr:ankyrin repeat domain-containing protein [Burkholderia cepacia]NTX43089.1 ankyrin repeat domain-containing protein [Burkholderia cepacia]
MLSGQLDYRGLSDAIGLPENEINHRLYSGREPTLGRIVGEAESPIRRPARATVLKRFHPAPAGPDELLTQAQVARELGFSDASVCNMVKKGRLATTLKDGRRYVRRSDLDAFRATRFPPNRDEVMTVSEVMRMMGYRAHQSVYRLLRECNIQPQTFGGTMYLGRDDVATLQRRRNGGDRTPSAPVTPDVAPAAPTTKITAQQSPSPAFVAPMVQVPTQQTEHPERPVYAGPNRRMAVHQFYQQAKRTVPDPTSPTGFAVRRGTPVCTDDMTDLHMLAYRMVGQALASRLHCATPEVINARTANGETPLHFAARRGNARGLAMLLAHGAGVHAVDEFGLTALHHAAELGHQDVVLLLAFGGRPDQKSYDGQTTLDLAKHDGIRAALQVGQAKG